jgi:hypothetical protein
MIYQKVLKGIAGGDRVGARRVLSQTGIICNWWRQVNPLPQNEIVVRLTERNIEWHLSRYDDHDPLTGRPFGELTPFISTTAGGVGRDPYLMINEPHSAFVTAVGFATRQFTTRGVVFYGYVNVIGKKALPLQEFSEETRELNIWTAFQPYHWEGEIVAKISIPPPHLEKAECYDGPRVLADLNALRNPSPLWVEHNTGVYARPEKYSNVREPIL